jgi:hypothetical protein
LYYEGQNDDSTAILTNSDNLYGATAIERMVNFCITSENISQEEIDNYGGGEYLYYDENQMMYKIDASYALNKIKLSNQDIKKPPLLVESVDGAVNILFSYPYTSGAYVYHHTVNNVWTKLSNSNDFYSFLADENTDFLANDYFYVSFEDFSDEDMQAGMVNLDFSNAIDNIHVLQGFNTLKGT